MQSCIWSCRSCPFNPCAAAWQAKRLLGATGAAGAVLVWTTAGGDGDGDGDEDEDEDGDGDGDGDGAVLDD